MEQGELGGVICPGCGDEVFRILEGKCMPCLNGRKKQTEKRWERKNLIRHLRQSLRRGDGYKGESLPR